MDFNVKQKIIETLYKLAEDTDTQEEVLTESVNDHAENHRKTIDHIGMKHADNAGWHAIDKSDDELDRVHHAHKEIAKIHDAHATIHRANGNHEGADAHEEAAARHHGHAKISTKSYGRRIAHKNLESHEEYDHSSNDANEISREAMKDHPL
jgi:hypothetical protein